MSERDTPSDIEAIRLTRLEYGAVLDHQIAHSDGLDDKAMRTVRTAVILLGILVTATGIVGRTYVGNPPTGATLGFAIGAMGLVGTIFRGVGAYTVTEPRFGVDGSHHREVTVTPYSEREWLTLLLGEYEKWTDEMTETNTANANYVYQTQALMAGSLVVLLLATTLLAFGL